MNYDRKRKQERMRQMNMRKRLWVTMLLPAVILVIPEWAGAQETVTVPDVVGLTQSAAEAAIEAANLYVGTVTTQCDNVVPAGQVISQNPVGGISVTEGTTVNLVISTGPCPVTVPNVVFLEQAAAEAQITELGLVVGIVTTQCDNAIPQGLVVSQNPVSGSEIPYGSAVDLVVSSGPCPVTVPDVVGQNQVAAQTTLTAAGLIANPITLECSNTVPAGNVISQTPAGGETVLYGASIALVISTGNCPESVAVPGVVGQTQSAAESAIQDAGLTVGTVSTQCSDTVPAGQVISQNPAGGVFMSFGSAVSLVVSTGPCPAQLVTVPNVVGQVQTAATSTIQNAGLAVADPLLICSNTVQARNVISQFPAAGTQVASGSPILLVVSTGTCGGVQLLNVPAVTGLAQADAQAAIAAAQLTVGLVSTQCSDTVAVGSVITQAPAAGASVAQGTPVSLVVSSGPCTTSGPVTVPNLVGQPESVARTLLSNSGLTAGDQLYVFSTSKNPNTVLRQHPAAGQTVDRGTPVDLVISRGLNLDPPSNRDIMKQLYDRLAELDINEDGLSLDEAVAVYGLPGVPIEVFELIDKNGDGVITEAEFVDYLGIGGCFGCVKRLFVKDMLVSAGGDLLLAGLGLAMLGAMAIRKRG